MATGAIDEQGELRRIIDQRDSRLAVASVLAASAYVVSLVAAILLLVVAVEFDENAASLASLVLRVGHHVLFAAAFGTFASGFRTRRDRRAQRLRAAVILLGAGYVVFVAEDIAQTVAVGNPDNLGLAGNVVGPIGAFVVVVAAAMLVIALTRRRHDVTYNLDPAFARVAVVMAISGFFAVTESLLEAIDCSASPHGPVRTGNLAVDWTMFGGAVLRILAFAIVAVGLQHSYRYPYLARIRAKEAVWGLSARLLGIASFVFAVGYMVFPTEVGSLLSTKVAASWWLYGGATVLLAVAAGEASLGFTRSRRALAHRSTS